MEKKASARVCLGPEVGRDEEITAEQNLEGCCSAIKAGDGDIPVPPRRSSLRNGTIAARTEHREVRHHSEKILIKLLYFNNLREFADACVGNRTSNAVHNWKGTATIPVRSKLSGNSRA